MKKDPYEENIHSKCSVCEHDMLVDKFGNGTCKNCSWQNQIFDRANEDTVVYPNLIPINKARRLYKENKPFTPSIEDFLGGLFFYSEMEFTYKGEKYAVYLMNGDDKIYLSSKKIQNIYNTKEDFLAKASIDGKLLKDIWHLVKDPYWLS